MRISMNNSWRQVEITGYVGFSLSASPNDPVEALLDFVEASIEARWLMIN